MAVAIDEAFERLAALRASEDLAERGAQDLGLDRIEDGAHLRVGGDAVDPIDGAEVIRGVASSVVEGEEGGVLEREHREGRHDGVAQGDLDRAGARVRERAELGVEELKEGVGGKIFARLTESESHSGPLPPPG